jgi:hypothetical protein
VGCSVPLGPCAFSEVHPRVVEGHYSIGIPANLGWLHRGVAYWRSGDDERVAILTAFAHIISLDAKTGKLVPKFGVDGWVDLTQGLQRPVNRIDYTMTSPPVIVRDVIVVGSSVWDWWGATHPLPATCAALTCARAPSPVPASSFPAEPASKTQLRENICHVAKNCPEIGNCAEAYYRLLTCGHKWLDGAPRNGVPCKRLCGKTPEARDRQIAQDGGPFSPKSRQIGVRLCTPPV